MCILTNLRAVEADHVEESNGDHLPIASLLPGLTTIDAAHCGPTPAAFAMLLTQMTAGKPAEMTESTGCFSRDLLTLRQAPALPLERFVAHFCRTASVEQSTLIVVAAYMIRLASKPVPHHHDHSSGACVPCAAVAVNVNPCNVHRLFSACAVLACKFVNDRVYPMSYYAAQLQLKPDDLRLLEGEVCRLLDFNLVVHGQEFNAASVAISSMHALRGGVMAG
jgi:hypothetical protein